ncbi:MULTISPECIES: hypothetical protein [unclassified Flavobacterium]|uniref:hypothetical protein n=1 Tax=unclassified Flavobacterium TaxID=196869 RepID=UPI001F1372FA|nr:MULTISPECIES: hypothetical protein [unclassified Flavobacterium]UMY67147.1 hypothetical protein MKO97_07145 [Flavobacterium sp. HJ-32-4]
MKHLLSLLALFLTIGATAQKKLEMTNIANTGKKVVLEENTRVKIRTSDMKKHIGELHFTADGKLLVDGAEIPLETITSIKKQSKSFGTLKTVVLIVGVATMGAAAIVAASGGEAAFLLFATGSGLSIGSGILETVNPNYTKRKWTYQLTE